MDGVSATSYSISYSATDTDCFTDSGSITIASSETMYTLDDLEEGTEYSITVTATITGGMSHEDMIVGTTMAAGECISKQFRLPLSHTHTAPSAPPSSVRVSVENCTAISVQWGPVEPCSNWNGPITGYSVRYGTKTMSVTGDSSGGMTTISGLNKATVYTVEVAAETRAGTRVYSLPLIIQTPDSE